MTWREEVAIAAQDPYLDLAKRRTKYEGLVALVVRLGEICVHEARYDGLYIVVRNIMVSSPRGSWSYVPPGMADSLCCILGTIDVTDIPDEVFADWLRDTVEKAGCRCGPLKE